MAEALELDPLAGFCLLPLADERRLDEVGARQGDTIDHDYVTSASAQKIYFEPGTLSEYKLLQHAFEALAVEVPSPAQARAVFAEQAARLTRYAYEERGDTWHIRYRGPERFSWSTTEWVLYTRVGAAPWTRSELGRIPLDQAFAFLPLLDGTRDLDELVRQVRALGAPAARLFRRFAETGLLRRTPRRDLELAGLPPVLFLNHSSLAIRGRDSLVLVDPVFGPPSHRLAGPGRTPAALLGRADAVLVSHNHWDHLWIETFLRLPRHTPIYVPRCHRPSFANPPLKAYLEGFGFTAVHECQAGDVLHTKDITTEIVGFHGEPAGLDSAFDAFTYRIEAAGRVLYGSLDACHDERGSMDPIVERLGQGRPLDYFFFGSSDQHHQPLYRAAHMRHFSNELLARPDLVRYHPNVDDVARWARWLAPRFLVPYAEFVFEGVAAPDVHERDFSAGSSNADAYWQEMSGVDAGLATQLSRWRADLERLRRASAAPLMLLHPMQGIHFDA